MTACPTLLTCSSATTIASAQQLQHLLHWDESQLRTAVCMYPQLLGMSGRAVKERINELAAALDFQVFNKHIKQLVATCPMCLLSQVDPSIIASAVQLIADKLQHARSLQHPGNSTALGHSVGQESVSGSESRSAEPKQEQRGMRPHDALLLAVSAICKQPALLDAGYRKVATTY